MEQLGRQAEDRPAGPTPAEAPRVVRGRYLVQVDTLDAHGVAQGAVIQTHQSPDDDAFAAVYGPAWATHAPPARLAMVGGLPGELVEVEAEWRLPRPGRKRAKHTPPPQVRVLRVVQDVPARVAAQCPVFGTCGGCQLQHMAYPAQLTWKTGRVCDELCATGFAAPPVLPALASPKAWHYRNHMRFSVNREGQAGLTARGSRRVLPLRTCPIAEERINDTLVVLADTPLPQPQALIRSSAATGQVLMQPAPSVEAHARLEAAGIAVRESDLDEELGGITFRIRPSSFFQTNTAQATRMTEEVVRLLPAGPDATLVDAYCGVGTFAALLARRAGRVIAIEESASAIRDARWNLRDVANVSIMQAKVENVLPALEERLDGLVIDPPRAGCQRPVLAALAARRVPRVVYVSCDPATLARDLAYLCQTAAAYRLVSVQPLDMFPQTAHIETIALLEAAA